MKIVKFNNGLFGIRTGNWFYGYEFLHLNNPEYTCKNKYKYFKYCQGDLLTCLKVLDTLKDNGIPIHQNEYLSLM